MTDKKGLQSQAKVLMADGSYKTLSEVKVGDLVKGRSSINTVVNVTKIIKDDLIVYGIDNKPPFIIESQPFYYDDKWIVFNLDDLIENDPDTYYDIVENKQEIIDVAKCNSSSATEDTIYQLLLDGDHTYYLEDQLVHNGGKGGKTVYAPRPEDVITTYTGDFSFASYGAGKISSGIPEFGGVAVNNLSNAPFVPTVIQPTQILPQPVTGGPEAIKPQNLRRSVNQIDIQREEVCSDILGDAESILPKQQIITGNGSATRFRFSERGVPTDVVVTNISSGVILSSDDYTITPRADSFAFINFDSAPSNGVKYSINFEISNGGNQTTRTSTLSQWTNWIQDLSRIEINLTNIRNNLVERSSSAAYKNGWSISNFTLIDTALDSLKDLKKDLKKPGSLINLENVSNRCNYLDAQLAKIQNDLEYGQAPICVLPGPGIIPIAPIPQPPATNCPAIYPPLPGCAPQVYPVVQSVNVSVNVDINISSRCYSSDARYPYFVRGQGNFYFYAPPNSRINPTKRWRKFKDSDGRDYYELSSGSKFPGE